VPQTLYLVAGTVIAGKFGQDLSHRWAAYEDWLPHQILSSLISFLSFAGWLRGRFCWA
jgi:hypothetical protein